MSGLDLSLPEPRFWPSTDLLLAQPAVQVQSDSATLGAQPMPPGSAGQGLQSRPQAGASVRQRQPQPGEPRQGSHSAGIALQQARGIN